MLSDMRVSELGDRILLDLPEATADSVRQRLADFIFTEDVEVRDAGRRPRQLRALRTAAARCCRRCSTASADHDAAVYRRASSRRCPHAMANRGARLRRGTGGRRQERRLRRRADSRLFVSTSEADRWVRCPARAGRRRRRGRCGGSDARRSRAARVRLGHGRSHHPARSRDRSARDQPDQGLLCRAGSDRPRPPPRPGPGREASGRPDRG